MSCFLGILVALSSKMNSKFLTFAVMDYGLLFPHMFGGNDCPKCFPASIIRSRMQYNHLYEAMSRIWLRA
jgi:hypothetical protein